MEVNKNLRREVLKYKTSSYHQRHGQNGITESGLKLRWDNKLDPKISKLPFKDPELEEIANLRLESKSWKEISQIISKKYCNPPQRRTALDCFKASRIGFNRVE